MQHDAPKTGVLKSDWWILWKKDINNVRQSQQLIWVKKSISQLYDWWKYLSKSFAKQRQITVMLLLFCDTRACLFSPEKCCDTLFRLKTIVNFLLLIAIFWKAKCSSIVPRIIILLCNSRNKGPFLWNIQIKDCYLNQILPSSNFHLPYILKI